MGSASLEKKRAFIGESVVVMAAGKASEFLTLQISQNSCSGTNLVLIQVMEMKERRGRKSKVEKGKGKEVTLVISFAKLYPLFCSPMDKPTRL